MTESKKLQTVLYDYGFLYPTHGTPPPIAALEHDARVAHEQREVIRQLNAAIQILQDHLHWTTDRHKVPMASVKGAISKGENARQAASPYLQD